MEAKTIWMKRKRIYRTEERRKEEIIKYQRRQIKI